MPRETILNHGLLGNETQFHIRFKNMVNTLFYKSAGVHQIHIEGHAGHIDLHKHKT